MNDFTDDLRHAKSPYAAGPRQLPEGDAVRLARRIAPLAVDVLLQGETGAGKDTLAREIHRVSARPGRFVALNCAAIPESLAESELFGHEAGAFTGAVRAREGKLETADKGTLYLDEIDSMPLGTQAKLLRALQERGIERLGGSRFYRADFRVIASTKVALPQLVQEGRFRQDLYFRLNVVRIVLPSLRDLGEHILPFFERFAREAATRHGQPEPSFNAVLRAMLQRHPWPGNVRELANAAERHALGLPPLDDDLMVSGSPSVNALRPVTPIEGQNGVLRDRLRAYEREVIVTTLKSHQGSVTKASAELQVPPNTLYYRIKTLGIQFQPE
ncbi:MAG TPA: sigma-54 dependent transcriptional regulator [Rhizobacter sp.]|nr:sigma-54 dependent transcriptional regulator [Rhizobacter sp.]